MNFTEHYNLYIPVHGEYPGNWDIPVNQNFNSIDSIIKSLEINSKSLTAPVGKESGTTWYDMSKNKLCIKKPNGYFELIDSENYVAIIGEVIIKDDTLPPAPSGLILNKYGDAASGETPLFYTIEASWDPANDQTNFPSLYHDDFLAYILTISRDSDSFYEQKISYTNSYKFTNIKAGYRYNVSVSVIDKQGNISQSSITASVDIYDTSIFPLSPTGLSAVGTFKGIIVSWNKPLTNDIIGYEVHAGLTTDFTPDAQINSDSLLSSTTLKYSGLSTVITINKDITTNTTYYIKVRAKNRAGNWSTFSTVRSATTAGVSTADFEDLAVVNAIIGDLAADDIRASFVEATQINASEINGERIITESITGDKLAFKSITADKILGGGDKVDVAANKWLQVTAGNVINGGMCKYTLEDSGVWQVFSNQMPASAIIDLTDADSTISEITEVSFTSYPTTNVDFIPGKFIIEYSIDGYIWTEAASIANNFKPSAISEIYKQIGSITARYIKLTIPTDACQAGSDYVYISNFKVFSKRGGTLITGDIVKTGSLTADHISTTSLSSISANLGAITAGTIDMISSQSFLKAGQSSFGNGTGFWLGRDSDGKAKFSIGDLASSITWDGLSLNISGDVLIGGTPAIDMASKNDISYKVEVVSSNGLYTPVTSDPDEVLTTLTAKVYQGINDITASIDASRFIWIRVSSDPSFSAEDAAWNSSHTSGYKTIDVTSKDIHQRATFSCSILES